MTKGREESEKKWQQSIDAIAHGKNGRFLQVGFSATPYTKRGGGVFFPHICVAIQQGLVKMLVLDKRTEMAARPDDELDFRAVRDDKGEGPSALLGHGFTVGRLGLSKNTVADIVKRSRAALPAVANT